MNPFSSALLKAGVSSLALIAAMALTSGTAQAAACGTIDPAEIYDPGNMNAEIVCENGSFDEARNATPGGFGRATLRVLDATILGDVVNDLDSVLDSTGTFFPALEILNSTVNGVVRNDGLLRDFASGGDVVRISADSISSPTSIGGFLNNQFIYGEDFFNGANFFNVISTGNVTNNGTVSAGIGFTFSNTLIQGALKQTVLGTIDATSGDAFELYNTIVEGGIELDGVGTAYNNFLTISSGNVSSCSVSGSASVATGELSGLAVFEDVCDGSIVQGNVVLKGDFFAEYAGVQLGQYSGFGAPAIVNGNIIVSGRLVSEYGNGISILYDGDLNGKIIVQAGGQLIAEYGNGIYVDGEANGIDVFGRVQGGNTGIDTSDSETAVPINLYTGGVIVGTNSFSFSGSPASAVATGFAFGPSVSGGSYSDIFSTAIDSTNGISETHTAFGGLIEGNVFGDYGRPGTDWPADVFVVSTVGQGVQTGIGHLRTVNAFAWLPGDGDGGFGDDYGYSPFGVVLPSFYLNAILIERGAALFGTSWVDPYTGPDICEKGCSSSPVGFAGIQVADFTIAANAVGYFTPDVRLKVTDISTFTLAPGATWVIGAGIVDTIQANRNAGGAIAALTVPTPNDKCDYFSVNCPYYNAAGFNVQIPRVLAQSGQVNGANLVVATDSVRFINQARVAPRTFIYDDVVQDLNNVGDFLNGRFATISTISPVFINAVGRYRNLNEQDVAAGAYDNFDLELTPITYEQAAGTANKRAVGWALDNFAQCYVNGGTCPAFFNDNLIAGTTLRAAWVGILENVAELSSAADYATFGWNVQGDQYAQASQFGMNLLEYWTQGVNNRLRNALYSQNGVEWADNGGVQVASVGGAGLSGIGASGAALGAAKGGTDGWAFWGRGIAQFADEDGDAEARGYEYDTLGFQGGVDWTSSSGTFLVGGSVLWSQSEVEFTSASLEHADVDTLQAGVYATYGFGNWYWNAQASIARNDVELNRVIDFNLPLVMGGNFFERTQLWSGYTQTGWTAGTEIGTVWNGGDWNIQPYLGLKYRDLSAEDIVERSFGQGGVSIPGGLPGTPAPSPFALTVVDADAESLQSELGARFTTNWDFEGTMIRPEIEVSWLHEFLDTRQTALAHFNNAIFVSTGTPVFAVASPNFQIVSSDIGEDAGQVKLGFNAVLDDNWELYAGYRGLFTDGYQDHGATITIKANW